MVSTMVAAGIVMLLCSCASQQQRLIDAISLADTTSVRCALTKGANINRGPGDLVGAVPPLHHAIAAGSPTMVRYLIKHGAAPNTVNWGTFPDCGRGSSALHLAACLGAREVVEILIANGARVNATDRSFESPLMKAITAGHADVASILLAHGANVNEKSERGWTPLFYAADNEDIELMRMLVHHGASIHRKSDEGFDVAAFCENRGRADLAAELLETAEAVELERAWTEDSIEAYQSYIDHFPAGRGSAEADVRLAEFLEQREALLNALNESLGEVPWGLPMRVCKDSPEGLVADVEKYPAWAYIRFNHSINSGTYYGGKGKTVLEAARLTTMAVFNSIRSNCRKASLEYGRAHEDRHSQEEYGLMPQSGTIVVTLHLKDWKGFKEGTEYHPLYSVALDIPSWRASGYTSEYETLWTVQLNNTSRYRLHQF